MSSHVSEFDALISQYKAAVEVEAPLWHAVEAARQNADAAFNPSLLSAWFVKHEVAEALFRKIEAMQRDGKGWHA